MVKNYKFLDFPAILFDLSAATVENGSVKLTIGAIGPRRQCSPWQREFEAWAEKYKLAHESEIDNGQKGIRRREMSVVLDTETLLNLIILEISGYSDMGRYMERTEEAVSAVRRARKAKLHPSEIYSKPQEKTRNQKD